MRRLFLILALLGVFVHATPLWAAETGTGSVESPNQSDFSTVQVSPSTPNGHPANLLIHGAYVPPINYYGTEILAYDNLVGKDLGIVHYFTDMRWPADTYHWLVSNIEQQMPVDRRPAVMFTWIPSGRNCRTMQPWDTGNPSTEISLYDIVNGYCDPYFSMAADVMKDWPVVPLIRFGHEMNLSGSHWWVGHYNRDPQLYIDAYRHVHDVFIAQGATNVQWVWGPSFASYPPEDWNDYYHYYPGDQYVDWVNLIGYNWTEVLGWPWWSLNEIFDSENWDYAISEASCRFAKPIMLETATLEGSRPGDGTKAAWVQQAYQQAQDHPFVRALVWFNDWDRADTSRADLRLVGTSYRDPDPWHQGYAFALPEGNGSWTQAYRAALTSPKVVGDLPPLQDITPPSTWCSDRAVFNVPSGLFIRPGERRSFTISAIGLTEDVPLAFGQLPNGVRLTLGAQTLREPWDTVAAELAIDRNTPLGTHKISIMFGSSPVIEQELVLQLTITNRLYRTFVPIAGNKR